MPEVPPDSAGGQPASSEPAGQPPVNPPPAYPAAPPPYPGSPPPAPPVSPPYAAPSGYVPPGATQAPGYPPPPAPPQPGYAPPPPPGGYPPAGPYQGAGGYPPAGAPVLSPYSSFGARLGGWLIDFVILGVVGGIINAIFDAAKVTRITFHSHTTVNGVTTYHVGHFSVLAPILQVIIVLLYGAILCGSSGGQTLGMMAVGARAVDRDTGTPIGFGRALGRAAFEYLLFILFFIPWVVDMLFPAWDAKRQALHDKVSRTVVVKTRAIPANG